MPRINAAQAAEKLDMPVQTFRWMVYNGKFPEFAVGTPPCEEHRGMIYVNAERLEAYLNCRDLIPAEEKARSSL